MAFGVALGIALVAVALRVGRPFLEAFLGAFLVAFGVAFDMFGAVGLRPGNLRPGSIVAEDIVLAGSRLVCGVQADLVVVAACEFFFGVVRFLSL